MIQNLKYNELQEMIAFKYFTDEEIRIIELRKRGWLLKSIAAELYISESTVRRRVKCINAKIEHFLGTIEN